METVLPEKAEQKRKQIKDMIAKDAVAHEGDNKQYNTYEINFALKEMLIEMGFPNMDWTMWLFTKPRIIINNSRKMDVVPIYILSGEQAIAPDCILKEGYSVNFTNQPVLQPKVVVVFIFPFDKQSTSPAQSLDAPRVQH
ncbi:uncharacterized protein MCYG_02182 [Microsporum canis CBS 113480]|uniref:Uncharacterized protein n=1 Tax=Arthroderma otae (strain ATCC MYA-4605 / CBS 113480) TaxID=554155 RepID=C5FJ33_ARTOC|nr:uncharacterized protein MCYG_02182 [Microsporum canis CBS 113480]EEQ29363.1 predicted protein [Microsporum canis CBS 113480]